MNIILKLVLGTVLLTTLIGGGYLLGNMSAVGRGGSTPVTEPEAAVSTKASAESTSVLQRGTVIDLSGQGLTKVPEATFSKTATEELNLADNQLTGALPSQVGQLKNLTALNLSNNQFTGVPAEVGQLSKLQTLDLSNNQLTGLPYELGNLQNLQVLNLKGNAYAAADLEKIKEALPANTQILID